MNGIMKERCDCQRLKEAKKNLEKAQKEYDEARKSAEKDYYPDPIIVPMPYPVPVDRYPWRYPYNPSITFTSNNTSELKDVNLV